MGSLVILTVLSLVDEVPKESERCFEMYGFDVLFDEALKPWLLEVNLSPALGIDCQQDRDVKIPLIGDLMRILKFKAEDAEKIAPLKKGARPPSRPQSASR